MNAVAPFVYGSLYAQPIFWGHWSCFDLFIDLYGVPSRPHRIAECQDASDDEDCTDEPLYSNSLTDKNEADREEHDW